jgi:hypothetical protein
LTTNLCVPYLPPHPPKPKTPVCFLSLIGLNIFMCVTSKVRGVSAVKNLSEENHTYPPYTHPIAV